MTVVQDAIIIIIRICQKNINSHAIIITTNVIVLASNTVSFITLTEVSSQLCLDFAHFSFQWDGVSPVLHWIIRPGIHWGMSTMMQHFKIHYRGTQAYTHTWHTICLAVHSRSPHPPSVTENASTCNDTHACRHALTQCIDEDIISLKGLFYMYITYREGGWEKQPREREREVIPSQFVLYRTHFI